MKRLVAAALATLMLVGCGSGDRSSDESHLPTEQSVTEIQNPSDSETTASSFSNSRIIYRERIYNINSYTKSDFFIESSGRVWCGFYMHNEGTIDKLNRLWTSDVDYSENYKLDDDIWLASVLSETKDDDFMLFGETYDFDSISGEKLSAISDNIAAADPFSACNVTKSQEEVIHDYIEDEYIFIDLIIGDDVCRSYVNTQGYISSVQDGNANTAIENVHALPEYKQWRDLCTKYLVPYSSE